MYSAVVVFSKVPETGVSKTRLMEENGGILTPEEARDFYAACVMDVMESCLQAKNYLREPFDLLVCYNQDGSLEEFQNMVEAELPHYPAPQFFADKGGTFDDKMQYALDYCLNKGYERVVIVGGDLPTLQPQIVADSIRLLDQIRSSNGALVTAPCQEGGFSLVGVVRGTPFSFDQVFYNAQGITASDMLLNKAKEENIPLGILEQVPDVDIPVDIGGQLSVWLTLQYASQYQQVHAPRRVLNVVDKIGLSSYALPEE